ncbi:hypothetical protein FQZ97_691030 [compost metagenome]
MAFIDINIRFSTGAYMASCPGHKPRASSAMNPAAAASRLAGKLHPNAAIERVECLKEGGGHDTGVWRCHLAFEKRA